MSNQAPSTGEVSRTVVLALERDRAFELVQHAAELWAGGLERNGNRADIELPLMAGLRHGWAVGQVEVEEREDGSLVKITTEPVPYHLHRSAFFVLLMGGLGSTGVLVLPFFHQLLPMIPVALVLMLAAWFLVASRVRHRNLEDFVRLIEEMATDSGEDEEPAAPSSSGTA